MSRTDGWGSARRLAALSTRPPSRPLRDARRDPDTVPLPAPEGTDAPEPLDRPRPGLASWSEVGARVPAPRAVPRRGRARYDGVPSDPWASGPGPEDLPVREVAGRDPVGTDGTGWDVPAPEEAGRDGDDDPDRPPDDVARAPRPPGTGRVRRTLHRWLPASLADSLVDPGRPGAIALVLVVLAAAVLAGFGVWSSRPQAQPVAGLPAVSVGGSPPSSGSAPTAAPAAQVGPLVVSVVGKVARPGLVRVPDGSRVADAVDAAGGALPGVDLSVLNLARRLGDGEQVAIGVKPAPDAAAAGAPAGGGAASGVSGDAGSGGARSGGAGSGSAAGSAAGGAAPGAGGAKVNLNQATAEQLDALPGVGPVTAKKILDWRTQNGRFSRVEQLREVDGIGERKFAQLRDAVTV